MSSHIIISNEINCIQDWDHNIPDAWQSEDLRFFSWCVIQGHPDFLLCCAIYKDTQIAHIARGQCKSWVNASLGRLRLTGLKVTVTIEILKGWDVWITTKDNLLQRADCMYSSALYEGHFGPYLISASPFTFFELYTRGKRKRKCTLYHQWLKMNIKEKI